MKHVENNPNVGDDALAKKAQSGDHSSEELLIAKYGQLVKACARPYFLAGGDSEDLIQEGMLGLMSAIRQYDSSRNASFKTYAERCIKTRLYSVLKAAARNKHAPLNNYVSFESPQFDEIQTRFSYYLRDPEELLISREHFEELLHGLGCALSGFESKVLVLYLEGISYHEIAQRLNKTPKSIDNAVQRIRKKLEAAI